MQQPLFYEEVRADGVARLTLSRAEVHNAFNDRLIFPRASDIRVSAGSTMPSSQSLAVA